MRGGATALFTAFLLVSMLAIAEAGQVEVQSSAVVPDTRTGSYNGSSIVGREQEGMGGGGGSGKGTRSAAPRGTRTRHRRPSYSSSLYRVGEYARCTAPGRCRGMKLLCSMQCECEGPCFYDCDANCKPHCRF